MTLHKKPTRFRQFLTNFLVFSFVLSTNLSTIGQTQDRSERQQREGGQRDGSTSRPHSHDGLEFGFVTYADGDKTTCRDMTQAEAVEFQRVPEHARQLRVITQWERQQALQNTPFAAQAEGVNGLTIVLRGTDQLNNFPEAKNAFILAAAQWEAQIKNPITVIIDVDYGPTRFGTPYPSGVLGSTGTSSTTQALDTVRTRLLNGASSAAETTLYNALPTGSINTDVGLLGSVRVPLPLARALGVFPADGTTADATIGFNSNFTFDFDPSNGITAGQTDFDAVAVHEMGHALGFISNVGGSSTSLSVWDMFRFRPGTTMPNFTTAQRVLTVGGEHRFFDGNPELACSTGGPSGTGGDNRQASHWKADEYTGVYIGIMDPTISSGQRKTMTNNDLRMLESIGYTISGTVPPPCTFSLSPTSASYASTGGTGSVTATASANTCTRTATSNATWITITSGASGTGTGSVGYSVAANTGGSRTGTLTIGGQTFTVTQAAAPPCSYTVTPFNQNFTSAGGTVTITVTTTNNCTWTTSESSSWLSFNATSRTGTNTVVLTVSRRTSTNLRTATIRVAGQQFTIRQQG